MARASEPRTWALRVREGVAVLVLGAGVTAFLGAIAWVNQGIEPPPRAIVTPAAGVRCFEDEVRVWSGAGHDRCVHIDDLDAWQEENR